MIELKPGLQQTATFDLAAIQALARNEGFEVFTLPGEGVVDRASFFDAVRNVFPLDPPLAGSQSWDALSDSLWEGLHRHQCQRIAILWPNASDMASKASAEFEVALAVLEDIASTVGDGKVVAVLVEQT